MGYRNSNRPPKRVPNSAVRTREYLTAEEVNSLRVAARGVGRNGLRDATLILLAYRHGLRVSELIDLRWDQVDLKRRLLHIRRLKNGTPSNHPLGKKERRGLRRLRERLPEATYVFMSERKGRLSSSTVRKIIARAGKHARIPFPVHPHMLRHACGYKLANDGHDTRAIQHYLDHRNINHTVRYTELSPERFRGFWKD
jgi:type 1 fimbriae regulatory protein FimB/type 1 fimbriae regulatory protein FimE